MSSKVCLPLAISYLVQLSLNNFIKNIPTRLPFYGESLLFISTSMWLIRLILTFPGYFFTSFTWVCCVGHTFACSMADKWTCWCVPDADIICARLFEVDGFASFCQVVFSVDVVCVCGMWPVEYKQTEHSIAELVGATSAKAAKTTKASKKNMFHKHHPHPRTDWLTGRSVSICPCDESQNYWINTE